MQNRVGVFDFLLGSIGYFPKLPRYLLKEIGIGDIGGVVVVGVVLFVAGVVGVLRRHKTTRKFYQGARGSSMAA